MITMDNNDTITIDLDYLKKAELHGYLGPKRGFFFSVQCNEKDEIDVNYLRRDGVDTVEVTDGYLSLTEYSKSGNRTWTKWGGTRIVKVKMEDDVWPSKVFPELT
jgi:hypothetical protein